MEASAQITEARAAWERIKAHEKTAFGDWVCIGRALIIGRQKCMAAACCNSPYGPGYQKHMRRFLDEAGLDIDSHERVAAVDLVENLPAITQWRASLTEDERRRAHHPIAMLQHWRRGTTPRRPGPKPRSSNNSTSSWARDGYVRRMAWSQESIRNVAAAIKETGMRDLFVMARAAMDATERELERMSRPAPASQKPASAVAMRDADAMLVLA